MVAQMSWWHKCLGGTNAVVALMSWWHKCHGGTNVLFYNRWDKCLILSIGGTNVMVAQMSGGTCVGGINGSGTYDSGTKVAPPLCSAIHYSSADKIKTFEIFELFISNQNN